MLDRITAKLKMAPVAPESTNKADASTQAQRDLWDSFSSVFAILYKYKLADQTAKYNVIKANQEELTKAAKANKNRDPIEQPVQANVIPEPKAEFPDRYARLLREMEASGIDTSAVIKVNKICDAIFTGVVKYTQSIYSAANAAPSPLDKFGVRKYSAASLSSDNMMPVLIDLLPENKNQLVELKRLIGGFIGVDSNGRVMPVAIVDSVKDGCDSSRCFTDLYGAVTMRLKNIAEREELEAVRAEEMKIAKHKLVEEPAPVPVVLEIDHEKGDKERHAWLQGIVDIVTKKQAEIKQQGPIQPQAQIAVQDTQSLRTANTLLLAPKPIASFVKTAKQIQETYEQLKTVYTEYLEKLEDDYDREITKDDSVAKVLVGRKHLDLGVIMSAAMKPAQQNEDDAITVARDYSRKNPVFKAVAIKLDAVTKIQSTLVAEDKPVIDRLRNFGHELSVQTKRPEVKAIKDTKLQTVLKWSAVVLAGIAGIGFFSKWTSQYVHNALFSRSAAHFNSLAKQSQNKVEKVTPRMGN